MFGKLKALINDVELIWDSIQQHGKDIAKLQADIEALKPKKKVVSKPAAKKTTKQFKTKKPPAYYSRGFLFTSVYVYVLFASYFNN